MAEVLIVEDDPSALTALTELVRAEGFTVRGAASLAEARTTVAESLPDLILCDLILPDGHGTDLLEDLAAEPAVEVIMITGNATVESAVEALRLGASDYLTKPIEIPRLQSLLQRLRDALVLREQVDELRRELRRLGRFGPLVGTSPAMQEVYDLIERVAPTEVTVLLTGESGSGKELAAEAVHRLSWRADRPFLPINCGAVAPQLIESELFGHEKGSFTGADRLHRGIFEQADGGTLFLDEITEMPGELQVKLLRVLESGEFVRIGGRRPVEVDVRVVAATNRDPEEAVRENRLRDDLYFRLAVFPIELPPLRARGDDVKLLAVHFLEQGEQVGGVRQRFHDSALELLAGHDWPGNVRELKNVVQRAAILAGEVIGPEHLPRALQQRPQAGRARLRAPLGTPLEEVVRSHTMATLEQLGGDKRRAAEMLGISLKTLYNRLHRYGETGREDGPSEEEPERG